MENRVVITGMGAVTPIGNTAYEFWNNAKQGKLGIDTIKSIDTEGLEVKVAGEVKDLDLTKFLDKKECRRLDRFTQYALIASMEAVQNANLDLDSIDKERFAFVDYVKGTIIYYKNVPYSKDYRRSILLPDKRLVAACSKRLLVIK